MSSEILIYQKNVIGTYLYFIKENLNLIRKLIEENSKIRLTAELYERRALHLQIMTVIGITAEHLIKIILLKRGYILNVVSFGDKFSEEFMLKLEKSNHETLSQEDLNRLYAESKENVNLDFKPQLKKFDECILLFYKSNSENYFDSLGSYILNPHPDIYNKDKYLEERELTPENSLRVIQRMRNSYLHRAEAREEKNGVIWYLANFLIRLCKKEYSDFFREEEYVGNQDVKNLFENATED